MPRSSRCVCVYVCVAAEVPAVTWCRVCLDARWAASHCVTRLQGDLGLRCQGRRSVCVCFMLFQILLPVMLPSICSLCGSLIRQWAGLRPCLKGWSPGLLAEHLLKDHSTGYIWGGLLSSYWSLPPSLSLYFFSFACPPTPCVCLCLCLYTLNSLPTATSSLLPFCHPLTSSVYSLRSLLPCPSISMLKYQQAQICHSKGPLLFFFFFFVKGIHLKDNNRLSPKSDVANWLQPPQQTHSVTREGWLCIMPKGIVRIPDVYASTTICSHFPANCGDYCAALHPKTVSHSFSRHYISFGLCFKANQSVFILYDVKKMSSRKGMYQTDSFKEKKKSTFICTKLKWDYLFFKPYCT